MRIGIYKPVKKICFGVDETDHSAISVEITRVIRMFAAEGHEVYILSANDYTPGSIKNVFSEAPKGLDVAFIYTSLLLTEDILNYCHALTPDVRLIVTDMGLMPPQELMGRFTKVFTQSKNFWEYGAIEKHEAWEATVESDVKTVRYYFGGTERGRSDDFFEYVYRPDCLWHGKSQTLDVRDYIPYESHIDIMTQTKYTIVIGDEAYNKVGFVTPRYYECLRYGVIAFVDHKYDPDQLMVSDYDFRRVRSYVELFVKMKQLDESPEMYKRILDEQRVELQKVAATAQYEITSRLLS